MYTLVQVILSNTKHVNVSIDEHKTVDEAVAMCLKDWFDLAESPYLFYVVNDDNVVQATLHGKAKSEFVCVLTTEGSTLSGIWRTVPETIDTKTIARVVKLSDTIFQPIESDWKTVSAEPFDRPTRIDGLKEMAASMKDV